MDGDSFIRETAQFVRQNQRPDIVLATDTHRLFYLLIRIQALNINVGDLDVLLHAPSRPMHYAPIYPNNDDARSVLSLASVVSTLSLASSWWSRTPPRDIDAELTYIYSSLTKLPALALTPPGPDTILQLRDDPPTRNAVPLDAFKNLQRLDLHDIDPRSLLGWDRLAESLRHLRVTNSGLLDVSVIFIGAVHDDHARRQAPNSHRSRHIPEPSISSEPLSPSSSAPLSPLKWAFLKHLCLSDNSLTFFPPEVIPYLKALSHLDLSSNLFVSVPPGLGELYNLVSLNLNDNLIDSVLAIYQNLGQVLTLKLARNRLESICGLERLLALERVDLRYNYLEESSEIGRLSVLPNISQLFVEGNPFVEIEERYRITCFDYFWKEGKHITLDGTTPTLYERRNLSIPEQATSTAPPFISSSAPVIAVEHAPRPMSAIISTTPSPSTSPSPRLAATTSASVHRRKKPKRVVDLNDSQNPSRSGSHSRKPSGDRPQPPQPDPRSTAHSDSEELPPPRRSRHSRYQTDYHIGPSPIANPDPVMHFSRSKMGSATVASRSDRRRGRISASIFEPPGTIALDDGGETYRKKIEMLKQDMGDGWLKVYNQS